MKLITYRDHVIYKFKNEYHIYRGTEKSFAIGSVPPFWLGFINSHEGACRMIDLLVSQNSQAHEMIIPRQKTQLKVRPLSLPMEARLVTIDNLEEIERWVNGSIKGISLPREQRVIRWYDQNLEGGDMEARIGNYVVKFHLQGFAVYDHNYFWKYFQEV
jgi:hypothetical protein